MALSRQTIRAIDRMHRELKTKSERAFSEMHAMEARGQDVPDAITDYCNMLDELVARMDAITASGTDDARRESLWNEWKGKVETALNTPFPGTKDSDTTKDTAAAPNASTGTSSDTTSTGTTP